MSRPVLRLYDGFDHTNPHLRDDVKELQKKLNEKGFSLNADGWFGGKTEEAVMQFQRDKDLENDGIVGRLTWAKLLDQVVSPLGAGHFQFDTTIAAGNTSLHAQLAEIDRRYKSLIEDAANSFGLQPCVIAGIGSRESHWGLILRPPGAGGTGDFIRRGGGLPPDGGGFGRGLMQIDYDAHAFARNGNWKAPKDNIHYGCKVLKGSYDFLQQRTNLEGRALLRAALAGYNCGPGNALKAVQRRLDIDHFTAKRDYSKNVLDRAGWFQLQGLD